MNVNIPSWSSPFGFRFCSITSISVWVVPVFVCRCKVDLPLLPSLEYSSCFSFNLELLERRALYECPGKHHKIWDAKHKIPCLSKFLGIKREKGSFILPHTWNSCTFLFIFRVISRIPLKNINSVIQSQISMMKPILWIMTNDPFC